MLLTSVNKIQRTTY